MADATATQRRAQQCCADVLHADNIYCAAEGNAVVFSCGNIARNIPGNIARNANAFAAGNICRNICATRKPCHCKG
jgi:hypothetical protein